MSPPGNSPRRGSTARRRREAELARALGALGRNDRDLLAALVTLIRYADAEALRAARVILGLTLRAARRRRARDMDPVTTYPWRPW